MDPVAAAEALAPNDLHQLVVAGPLRLILGFDEAREYLEHQPLPTRIPRAPDWVLGVLGLGGWAVPVIDILAWAQRVPASPLGILPGTRTTALKALRLREGVDAWALRLTQAPVVVNLAEAQPLAVDTALPLSVPATYGQLMPHAVRAWELPGQGLALQVRWSDVALALRQELAACTLGSAETPGRAL